MNVHIESVIGIIKRSPTLHTLQLQTRRETIIDGDFPFGLDNERHPGHNYLYAGTICALLSCGSLTTLNLGLLRVIPKDPKSEWHICDSIAALLPGLRRLRLRMLQICPNALTPLHDDKIQLKEVIVNLGTIIGSMSHSPRCRAQMGSKESISSKLLADLEQQATLLGARLTNPEMVRVLFDVNLDIEDDIELIETGTEMWAFEILQSKVLKLVGHVDWDEELLTNTNWENADGEVIEVQSVSEDELVEFVRHHPWIGESEVNMIRKYGNIGEQLIYI